MTASKNPENITGQVLSSFRPQVFAPGFPPLCNLHFPYGSKSHSILMWAFSLRSNLFASAKCLSNVKSLRKEEFQEVEN